MERLSMFTCQRVATAPAALAVSLLLIAAPLGSRAQDEPTAAPSEAPEEIEEIVVTGSRIARSNVNEVGPLTILTSDQISYSGVSTVDELLRDIPSMGLQGINRNNNNGGQGLAWVDMRNLGSTRTLVLMNGRRMVVSGSGVAEAVDLNNIPVSLIERVEVLRDGASAVYGSDAVAGVLNFVMKKDFDGAQVEVFAGTSDEADGDEWGFSATWGRNFERGNVTVNLSWLDREEIEQSDRGWAHVPVVAQFFDDPAVGSTVEIFGSGFPPEGRPLFEGSFFRPDSDSGASFQAFDSFLVTSQGGKRYNYGDEQWLMGNQERYSINLMGNYQLTDGVESYLETTYTFRDSRQMLAPQPLGFPIGKHLDFFSIPLTNPFIPEDFREAFFPEPEEGESIAIFLRRMIEVGNRTYDNEHETIRIVAGLRGELDRFSWDVFLNYGRNEDKELTKNSINETRARINVDPDLCAEDPACPFVGNWFGLGALQPEVANYIRYTNKDRYNYHLRSVGASISGDLFELPAGWVAAAIGVEYREEDGFFRPSQTIIAGDSSGNFINPTRGNYDVRELFGEVSIPILSGRPFAEELTLDYAIRLTDYDTFGSDTPYRVALSYAPTADLRLRGILSTSFRAPGISQLFGGTADSFESLTDPCDNWDTVAGPVVAANCEAAGVPPGFSMGALGVSQIKTNIGGNPDLDAEDSTLFGVGLVLTPSWLEGLSLTVDYYDVEIDKAIANPEPQVILNNCYETPGLGGDDCARIGRNLATGLVTTLSAAKANIGKVEATGLEAALGYPFYIRGVGELQIEALTHYLLDYVNTGQTGDKTKVNGTITSNSGAYANFRASVRATLTSEDWAFTNTVTYLGRADILGTDTLVDANDDLPNVLYWDLGLSYNLTDDWTLFAGVQNVTDKEPPFFLEGGQNASAETYDFAGRYYFGKVIFNWE